MNHHVETKSINLNLHCESLATIFFVRFLKKNSCGSLCRCWTKIVFWWGQKEKGCPAMLCLFKIMSLEAVWVQCWLRMVFDNIWKQSWNWIIFSESKAYPGITFLDSWRKKTSIEFAADCIHKGKVVFKLQILPNSMIDRPQINI